MPQGFAADYNHELDKAVYINVEPFLGRYYLFFPRTVYSAFHDLNQDLSERARLCTIFSRMQRKIITIEMILCSAYLTSIFPIREVLKGVTRIQSLLARDFIELLLLMMAIIWLLFE